MRTNLAAQDISMMTDILLDAGALLSEDLRLSIPIVKLLKLVSSEGVSITNNQTQLQHESYLVVRIPDRSRCIYYYTITR